MESFPFVDLIFFRFQNENGHQQQLGMGNTIPGTGGNDWTLSIALGSVNRIFCQEMELCNPWRILSYDIGVAGTKLSIFISYFNTAVNSFTVFYCRLL